MKYLNILMAGFLVLSVFSTAFCNISEPTELDSSSFNGPTSPTTWNVTELNGSINSAGISIIVPDCSPNILARLAGPQEPDHIWFEMNPMTSQWEQKTIVNEYGIHDVNFGMQNLISRSIDYDQDGESTNDIIAIDRNMFSPVNQNAQWVDWTSEDIGGYFSAAADKQGGIHFAGNGDGDGRQLWYAYQNGSSIITEGFESPVENPNTGNPSQVNIALGPDDVPYVYFLQWDEAYMEDKFYLAMKTNEGWDINEIEGGDTSSGGFSNSLSINEDGEFTLLYRTAGGTELKRNHNGTVETVFSGPLGTVPNPSSVIWHDEDEFSFIMAEEISSDTAMSDWNLLYYSQDEQGNWGSSTIFSILDGDIRSFDAAIDSEGSIHVAVKYLFATTWDESNPSWIFSHVTNSAGCTPTPIDDDDDNDAVIDTEDDCLRGVWNWTSFPETDHDGDGCRDIDEDDDDDNDGILDLGTDGVVGGSILSDDDNCPLGMSNWIAIRPEWSSPYVDDWTNETNDYDWDGCHDLIEDDDDDGDGVNDDIDLCPLGMRGIIVYSWAVSSLHGDYDGDGCDDSFSDEDADDDNDGVLDDIDQCPRGQPSTTYDGWVSTETNDADGDGCADPIDTDGDGVEDSIDACPSSPSFSVVDENGCTSQQRDADGDGVDNVQDGCPNTPSGIAVDENGCPLDSDGDGYPDDVDDFPNDDSEYLDSDGDGVGDESDEFPNNSTEWEDSDGDGYGNNVDVFPFDATEWADSDGDLVGDREDAFPNDENESSDLDLDGVGDNTDTFPLDPLDWQDSDEDGVGDNTDAFPLDPSDWEDTDNDGVGDNSDAFPLDSSEWVDSDGDGIGDNADQCDNSPVGSEIDPNGCEPKWEILGVEVTTAVGAGAGGLGLGSIGLFFIPRWRARKENQDSIWTGDELDEIFDDEGPSEEPVDNLSEPIVEQKGPSVILQGVSRDDGYEWLEYPEGTKKLYWRAQQGDEWQVWTDSE